MPARRTSHLPHPAHSPSHGARRLRPSRPTARPAPPARRAALPLLLPPLLVLILALALTACGDAGAPATPDGAGRGTGGTHRVRTYEGVVSVPDHPRRVVVLDTAELDSALTLGVRPVGAARVDAGGDLPGYLPAAATRGIRDVGTVGDPDLERIAALHPDLILTSAVRDGDRYDRLKAIAPTVMTETTGHPWKRNFRTHAEALGRTRQAKEATARYAAHVREVTRALGGRAAARALRTNAVRFLQGANTRVYGEQSYLATLFADVGLGRPPIVRRATDHDGLSLDISPERIDEADADVIFYASYGDPAESGQRRAVTGPLWHRMRAVREKHAFAVDDELWFQGIGYTAAGRILDELRADLTT